MVSCVVWCMVMVSWCVVMVVVVVVMVWCCPCVDRMLTGGAR